MKYGSSDLFLQLRTLTFPINFGFLNFRFQFFVLLVTFNVLFLPFSSYTIFSLFGLIYVIKPLNHQTTLSIDKIPMRHFCWPRKFDHRSIRFLPRLIGKMLDTVLFFHLILLQFSSKISF